MGAPFSFSIRRNPVVFQRVIRAYERTGNQMGHQNASYLKTRSGIFYFTRRIPNDLQRLYGRDRIYVSLRTRSRRQAIASSVKIAAELATSWNAKRSDLIISKHSLLAATANAITALDVHLPSQPKASTLPLLSRATEVYLNLKGKDRSPTFETSVRRSIRYLIEQLGDKAIDVYERKEALRLRDVFIERKLSSSSIKRNLNNINAVMGLVAKELGASAPNQFRSLFLSDAVDAKKRSAVPMHLVQQLQASCHEVDDEARWLLALISDTGMRLSEAIGLARSDLNLTDAVPHLTIMPHPWRRLKTIDSERKLPLIGRALWASQKAMQNNESQFLFPNFCDAKTVKSNSVSASLNKWLKAQIGDDYVVHSLRHSFRDRLRSVECPSEIADILGGWSQKTIGQSYGSGYKLETLYRWMRLLEANEVAVQDRNSSRADPQPSTASQLQCQP